MKRINANSMPNLPLLPQTVPWAVRQLCYAARKLPRGYSVIIPALAKIVRSLQEVIVNTKHNGPLCLDLREYVCIAVFVRGSYVHQLPEDHVLEHTLKPGMKVFDIGANIGYYTVYFSRRVKDSGLVVAVEPTPRGFRLLTRNAALCAPNVVILQAAIGAEPGRAQFFQNRRLNISTVRFGETTDKSSVNVKTIDQLTNDYGQPDVIKIDVEGAELHALNGATETLSKGNPPIIMIEYCEANAANFGGYSLSDLLKFFPTDRYKTFRIVSPGILRDISDDSDSMTNDYLVVPHERLSHVESLRV